MHSVTGKRLHTIDAMDVGAWAARYRDVALDLGTGDGRFVQSLARSCPDRAVIGVDTCPANLRTTSRTAPANALFVVADALTLPAELDGLATQVTINFPWGSLLRGLLDGHDGLLAGLRAIGRAHASLDVVLNAGALDEAGWPLDDGAMQIATILKRNGLRVRPVVSIGSGALRDRPTTWAKRLAFGRDPRAIQIRATLP